MIVLILFLSVTSVSDGFIKFICKEMLLKNVKHCQKSYPNSGEMVAEIFSRLKSTSYRSSIKPTEYSKCLPTEVLSFKERACIQNEYFFVDDWSNNIFYWCKQFTDFLKIRFFVHKYVSIESNDNVKSSSHRKFREFDTESALNLDVLMYQPPLNTGEAIIPGFRRKRYALFKYKWKKRNLTYCITKYAKSLPKKVVQREISKAFRLWTSVTSLKITEIKTGDADIILRFEEEMHGDLVSFDGPGKVLAHTFYPIMFDDGSQKSFIHFDDAETWTVYSKTGINLFQVALHEIGHALGLRHSVVDGSVMWPGHKGYQINFTLHEDDIRGIRALYGPANFKNVKN